MRWKRIALFLLIAFGFSWLVALPLYLFDAEGLMTIIAPIYMFGPLVSTVVLMVRYGDFSWRDIGFRWNVNVWWLAGWLFPALFVSATLVMSLIIPGVDLSPDMSGFMDKLSQYASPDEVEKARTSLQFMMGPVAIVYFLLAMVVGATFNALFAFGEESGWRGFLYMELRKLGFWKMSYLVGIVWGIWHAPLVLKGLNYPEHPVIGVFMMTLFTMLLSPILFFIREKAESVIAPSITHGTINAVGGFALLYIAGGNDLVVGITGLSGIIVLALFNVLIAMINRNKS